MKTVTLICGFLVLLLSNCTSSVTAFYSFPMSDSVAVDAGEPDFTANVYLTTSQRGGFSEPGDRLLLVVISDENENIRAELKSEFHTDVDLEIQGRWESSEPPVFLLTLSGMSEQLTFENTSELRLR